MEQQTCSDTRVRCYCAEMVCYDVTEAWIFMVCLIRSHRFVMLTNDIQLKKTDASTLEVQARSLKAFDCTVSIDVSMLMLVESCQYNLCSLLVK